MRRLLLCLKLIAAHCQLSSDFNLQTINFPIKCERLGLKIHLPPRAEMCVQPTPILQGRWGVAGQPPRKCRKMHKTPFLRGLNRGRQPESVANQSRALPIGCHCIWPLLLLLPCTPAQLQVLCPLAQTFGAGNSTRSHRRTKGIQLFELSD